jgi:aspartyl-tRNA synthetase
MAGREQLKKEFYCGEINDGFIGKEITVYGWVNNKRELGGITFIDLRDRKGILQIVVGEKFPDKSLIKKIGREYVLSVSGEVIRRSSPNPKIFTGNVELDARAISILAESELPPFLPENHEQVSEELRFKHRYLDLRNSTLQKNFQIRHQVNLRVRNYLDKNGFLDIETPILTKATPEGARDYLVPSRVYKHKMFALPQSPQLFKQLLMISGFERYYQIAKCFRDEDLRADRQPEFTQIDIEMSFAEPFELFTIIEGMMAEIFLTVGTKIKKGFALKTYDEVMEKYGNDKPDLRIPFEIVDFTESSLVLNSQIINSIVENQGTVKGLVLPEPVTYSRKILQNIDQFIKDNGGKGVIWIKISEGEFKSSLKIESENLEKFFRQNQIPSDKIVFLIGDTKPNAQFLAGKLREFLGKDFCDSQKMEFLWVTDFPLFFYNQEEKRLDSNHHPFTAPRKEDLEKLESDPLSVRSVAYDLVLNGVEIGGGSQRINDVNLQTKVFKLLKLGEAEIKEKFGFFLDALKFGTPPHLGIAMGFDRIIMLLTGEESIREIIAFPKTTSSLCLLTGSPSSVSEKQMRELGLKAGEPTSKRRKE